MFSFGKVLPAVLDIYHVRPVLTVCDPFRQSMYEKWRNW